MKGRLVRVGLVGFGRIAESAHAPAWQALPAVEVTAVADLCAERRQAAREAIPRARIYESCREMVGAERLDVLDICTPPHDHAPSILAGCEREVARIVCEKPLTVSLEEYRLIEEAQARSGTQVYTVNSWVQSDLHRLVCAVLETGTIGRVEQVTLRTLRPDCALGVPCWQPRWRTDRAFAGGGIVLDHGWHQLYLMARWIGAAPIGVDARLQTVQERHAPVEDQATLDLQFPGARGRIELSWAASERSNDGEIRGTRGAVQIGDRGLSILGEGGEQTHIYGERLSDSSYHPEWFTSFFARVLSDATREEGRRNLNEASMLLRTLDGAYKSAAEAKA